MLLSNSFTKWSLILACYLHSTLQMEDSNTKDCLYQQKVIISAPFLEFSISPGLTCWKYCYYLKNCTAISFALETSSLCSLYDERHLGFKIPRYNKNVSIYSGEKTCLQLVEIQQQFEVARKDGVYIRQVRSGMCLKVSSVLWSWGDEMLTWTKDCRANNTTSTLWRINKLETTTKGYIVRITDMDSRKCVTVRVMSHEHEMYSLAVLKDCSHEEEENQRMLMSPIDVLSGMGKWNIMRQDTYAFVSVTPQSNPMNDFDLLIGFVMVEQESFCERLNVAHGTLLVDSSQPLHLPGETIPVLCDLGYGVKVAGGYSHYTTTKCSSEMVVPECVKTESVDCKEASGMVTIPSTIFYSVIVIIVPAVLLFLIPVACVQRKRIQFLQSRPPTINIPLREISSGTPK